MDKLTEIMDAKRREIAPFARAVTDAELAALLTLGRQGIQRLIAAQNEALKTP